MSVNTIKTFTLLAGLSGMLVLAGQLIGGTSGAMIGFVLGLALVGGSYWRSDRIAIRAARAVPLEEADAPGLHAMVRELASRAGIVTPRLYLSPSPQPNAFATGRNEHHAVIAVTQGLLDQLSPEQVRGVLAHETAHIVNRDILIGSVAAAIATGISMVANLAIFDAMLGGGDDDGPGPVSVVAMAVLAPMAAGLIQMAVSRSREFEADRVAARLLGDGEPLAAALIKIETAARRIPMESPPPRPPTTSSIRSPVRGHASPVSSARTR